MNEKPMKYTDWTSGEPVEKEWPKEVAPHPGEQHDFLTVCLRCGERGMLNISLTGPDEKVTIEHV